MQVDQNLDVRTPLRYMLNIIIICIYHYYYMLYGFHIDKAIRSFSSILSHNKVTSILIPLLRNQRAIRMHVTQWHAL